MMRLNRISLQDGGILHRLVLAQLSDLPGRIELLEQGLSSESGPLCLGMDENRRFVLLLSILQDDDAVLVKALGQLSWVIRHQALLIRLYAERKPAPGKAPRVVLISPAFSISLQEAVSLIGWDLELYQYRAVEFNQERALLFDPIGIPGRMEYHPIVPVQSFPLDSSSSVQLTEAERSFFEGPVPKSLSA